MDGRAPTIAALAFAWLAIMFSFSVVLGTGGRARPAERLPVDPSSLHPYELAWLAGGPQRVADAVLVGLLERGQVRGTPDGRLASTGGEPDPPAGTDQPLDATAVELIAAGTGEATAVRRGLVRSPAMAGLRQRLRERKLLMGPIGRGFAAIRLYAGLVCSLAVLVVPPVLLVLALLWYEPEFGESSLPPLAAVPLVLICGVAGVGGLQTYLACRRVLRAGIRRRARHTVASARSLFPDVPNVPDVPDGHRPEARSEIQVRVALNGPGVHGRLLGSRGASRSSDQEYDGGLLKYVGRGPSRRSRSSGDSSAA